VHVDVLQGDAGEPHRGAVRDPAQQLAEEGAPHLGVVVAHPVQQLRPGQQHVQHLPDVVRDGLAADLQRSGEADRLRLADLSPAHRGAQHRVHVLTGRAGRRRRVNRGGSKCGASCVTCRFVTSARPKRGSLVRAFTSS
jgi:hypothetical protein